MNKGKVKQCQCSQCGHWSNIVGNHWGVSSGRGYSSTWFPLYGCPVCGEFAVTQATRYVNPEE